MTVTDNQTTNGACAAIYRRTRPRLGTLLRWVEHALAVLGLCFLVFHLCFELTTMTSPSMAPTLQVTSFQNGDRVLIEKVFGWFRSPRRWEVYFFDGEDGTPMAKRIVGLPGEEISLKATQLHVNDKELRLPQGLRWLKYYAYGNLQAGRKVACGRGYYVLGDDTKDSYDSRYVGPVERSQLRGRVWCIMWPPSRMGWVE